MIIEKEKILFENITGILITECYINLQLNLNIGYDLKDTI